MKQFHECSFTFLHSAGKITVTVSISGNMQTVLDDADVFTGFYIVFVFYALIQPQLYVIG